MTTCCVNFRIVGKFSEQVRINIGISRYQAINTSKRFFVQITIDALIASEHLKIRTFFFKLQKHSQPLLISSF